MSKCKLLRIKNSLDRLLSKYYFVNTMKDYLPSDATRQLSNTYIIEKAKEIAQKVSKEGTSSEFDPIRILNDIIIATSKGTTEISRAISPLQEENVKDVKEAVISTLPDSTLDERFWEDFKDATSHDDKEEFNSRTYHMHILKKGYSDSVEDYIQSVDNIGESKDNEPSMKKGIDLISAGVLSFTLLFILTAPVSTLKRVFDRIQTSIKDIIEAFKSGNNVLRTLQSSMITPFKATIEEIINKDQTFASIAMLSLSLIIWGGMEIHQVTNK